MKKSKSGEGAILHKDARKGLLEEWLRSRALKEGGGYRENICQGSSRAEEAAVGWVLRDTACPSEQSLVP